MINYDQVYYLSKHAMLLRRENGFTLISPLSSMEFQIKTRSLINLVGCLTQGVSLQRLSTETSSAELAAATLIMEVLERNRFLSTMSEGGEISESEDPLDWWETHDLFFHSRSRLGTYLGPTGATYRYHGVKNAPETRPLVDRSAMIVLPRPNKILDNGVDPSLTECLTQRRSAFSFNPLSVEELGDFLYRSFRVTGIVGGNEYFESFVQKVHPSGGGLYSLQLYAAVTNCKGLADGLYRYEDCEHGLSPVEEMDENVRKLFTIAARSTGPLLRPPPVILVVTSRFGRVAWKYQGIAYRLVLIEMGALYQTMYLVGTAMKLAVRALGNGDSEHFATLIRTSALSEPSIGEFALGAQ
jgi:SagB-type dehydrogenase family enzyme